MKRASSSYLIPLLVIIFLYFGNFFNKTIHLEEKQCAICFTPGEDCTGQIVNTIFSAKEEILVQSFSFTSAPIVDALCTAADKGINVRILLDKSNDIGKFPNPAVKKIRSHPKIQVLIDWPNGIAHNKVIIVDRKIIVTGSFNFSHAAQYRNTENVLIIHSPAIGEKYVKNWENRFSKSRKPALSLEGNVNNFTSRATSRRFTC